MNTPINELQEKDIKDTKDMIKLLNKSYNTPPTLVPNTTKLPAFRVPTWVYELLVFCTYHQGISEYKATGERLPTLLSEIVEVWAVGQRERLLAARIIKPDTSSLTSLDDKSITPPSA